jgi:hypothetical protein
MGRILGCGPTAQRPHGLLVQCAHGPRPHGARPTTVRPCGPQWWQRPMTAWCGPLLAALQPPAVAVTHNRAVRPATVRPCGPQRWQRPTTARRGASCMLSSGARLGQRGSRGGGAYRHGVRQAEGAAAMRCMDSEAMGTYREQRGVSGGVSTETMTAPVGIAHLARRGLAAAACGARTTGVAHSDTDE